MLSFERNLGEGAARRLEHYPNLNDIGGDPTETLQLCEGDCDSHIDCAPGLKCFLRYDFTPVPGCSGTGVGGWDYCIFPELNSVEGNPTETLQLCEGDCNTDDDCAPGLKCFQRDALESVPGCSGTGAYNVDYCVVDEEYTAPQLSTDVPVTFTPIAESGGGKTTNILLLSTSVSPHFLIYYDISHIS